MKLRAPSMPLITVDPYFSIWSDDNYLNHATTKHWTGSNNHIFGTLTVDGRTFSFLGYERNAHKMPQVSADYDALSTYYTFETEEIELNVRFMTPLLLDNYNLLTRPVSYMALSYTAKDGKKHDVSAKVLIDESLCLNRVVQSPVETKEMAITPSIKAIRMGNTNQNVLNRSGDDIRIDWGYVYLAVCDANATVAAAKSARGVTNVSLSTAMTEGKEALFLFAYDDIASIDYFGKHLKSYWNKDGKTIETAIAEAAAEYTELTEKCDAFSDDLYAKAYTAGGAQYAEILALSWRQVLAAHKLVVDDNGDILYVSKECFSNGCAVTVDVSYPSIPMFLYYNPELVRGMMIPVYKFNDSEAWNYDYAPHDVGRYPLVIGQVYGRTKDAYEGEVVHGTDAEGFLIDEKGHLVLRHEKQMPVEECGNMIIMETAVAIAEGNADFAAKHIDTLKGWCEYLIKYGDDPENQLCTDDFAGHLAHNCNLTLKAIMGIEGMSILMNMLGDKAAAKKYDKIAREKAKSWAARALNEDGSYRLAFDQPGSFSMKYNMVWDKLWGTKVFPASVYKAEIKSNLDRFNDYGMPLDSRSDYTKSDWLVWTATMANSMTDFKKFIAPMWRAYNEMTTRVPLTDWYDTISAKKVGFQHRTVQGGLFIKMLLDSGKQKLK